MSSDTKTEYAANFIEDLPRGEEVVIVPPNWDGDENPRWKELTGGNRGTMCPEGSFISSISSSMNAAYVGHHRGITHIDAVCSKV